MSLQNSDMFIPANPPFELTVSFNASGKVAFTGPGESLRVFIRERGDHSSRFQKARPDEVAKRASKSANG
jgi:hypothetical protein